MPVDIFSLWISITNGDSLDSKHEGEVGYRDAAPIWGCSDKGGRGEWSQGACFCSWAFVYGSSVWASLGEREETLDVGDWASGRGSRARYYREENSLPLVVLAELKIPFKDKLVTEKIQQRRHASTLLSVQTLQAHRLKGRSWDPQSGFLSWEPVKPRAGLDPLRHRGRAASCSSGQEAMWEPAFPAEPFISLTVTLKEAAERRGCSGISLCISSYRTGQSSRQESEFIHLLHLNS